MALDDDILDLTDTTAEDIEENTSGRDLPDGTYLVDCIDVEENTLPGHEGEISLKLKVITGKYNGCRITDRLKHPSSGETDDKQKAYRNQRGNYLRKLRVIDDSDFGKPIKPDWTRAIGHHIAVVIENRAFTKDNGDPGKFCGIKFFGGVYFPWDERVPEEIREPEPPDAPPLKSPAARKPAANGTTKAATKKAAVDYDNI